MAEAAAILSFPHDAAPRLAPSARAGFPPDPARVETLRRCASRAQISAPLKLETLCACGAGNAAEDGELWGRALLQCATAPGETLVLHRRGAARATEAECWLARLIERVSAGDADSAAFIAERRIPKRTRRMALCFAQRLAEALGAAEARATRFCEQAECCAPCAKAGDTAGQPT